MLVSVAVLAYEIALMRLLMVVSWHHFASVLISIALLGFGTSGTLLALLRRRVLPVASRALFALALATAIAMPVCAVLATRLPLEARFAPVLMWRQIGVWVLAGVLLAVPFLLGASAVGLALMVARRRLPAVYAANLLGSGFGAGIAPLAMLIVPPAGLPFAAALPAAGAALVMWPARWRTRSLVGVALVAMLLAGVLGAPSPRSGDPYKYGAFLELLVRQGDVERVGRQLGPRAVLEAFRGDALHDLPFLGVGAAPPRLSVIVRDGHWAGSVCAVASPKEAEALDHTLVAAAYDLAPQSPRVALLGEVGGANAWLAARHDATGIDVVQPDANVRRLLAGALADDGGAALLDLPALRVVNDEPRHFMSRGDGSYDLVQLVTLEGSAAGSGGIGGLGEDHLVTVEGLTACLRRLEPDGVLVACRGMQTPPRDNLKLLATVSKALRAMGVETPADHVVVLRDYLAVCTLVRPTPWTPDEIERVRQVCVRRQLTPVWFPGIREDELNRPDAMPSPPDGVGDWYHLGALRLLDAELSRDFIDGWLFDIRPPTDDRPFFGDYCRLRSIGKLPEAFGDLWLTRSELAYPFLIGVTVIIGIVGALLTLLPLRALPRPTVPGGRAATIGYFAAIGLAYLMLEITCLSRMTQLVGDPVVAASITIGGFLVLSGLGSLTVQLLTAARVRAAGVFAALIAFGLVGLAGHGVLGGAAWIPLAFVMGFPMPLALARLGRSAPSLLPWAWGINGFASVMAAPLATVIGMTWGFSWAGLTAMGLYAGAGMVHGGIPKRKTRGA